MPVGIGDGWLHRGGVIDTLGLSLKCTLYYVVNEDINSRYVMMLNVQVDTSQSYDLVSCVLN